MMKHTHNIKVNLREVIESNNPEISLLIELISKIVKETSRLSLGGLAVKLIEINKYFDPYNATSYQIIYDVEPAWTKITPEQNGWYWAYEDIDPHTNDVLCVFVRDGFCYSLESKFELNHFSHWIGPLGIPNPPDTVAVIQ